MSDNNDDVASQVQFKINELEQNMRVVAESKKTARLMFKNDPDYLFSPKCYLLDKTESVFRLARSFYLEHKRIDAAKSSFNQELIDEYYKNVLAELNIVSVYLKEINIGFSQIIAEKSVTQNVREGLERILSDMKDSFKFLIKQCEQFVVPVPSNIQEQPTNFEEIVAVTDSKVKYRFDEYQKVAKYCPVESPEYEEIFDDIMKIVENYYIPGIDTSFAQIQSFASIVGPSFMGKTQFAFSLARLFKVFYVNFSNDKNNQDVYKAFVGISNKFKRLLLKDCETVKSKINCLDSDKLSSPDAFDIQLLTIGFIWEFIEHSLKYDPSNSEWFEYYLQPRKLQFKAMSIGEYLVNLSNI